jgi:hypothetical protein
MANPRDQLLEISIANTPSFRGSGSLSPEGDLNGYA